MNHARIIKAAKEANDSDRWWEFADTLAEEVPVDEKGGGAPPPSRDGVNDGSHSALEDVADEILDETGILYSVNRLRQLRATAIAWAPEERDHEVEFVVHEALRGERAKPKLAMYKKRAADDYRRSPGFTGSPRLTYHRLRVYRAEERPAVSADESMRKRVRSLLKTAGSLAELDEMENAFAQFARARREDLSK